MSRMIDDEETLKDNGLIEIDGVNVAECSYFADNKACLAEYSCEFVEITEFSKCNEFKNCYFKQLQRLKAENEELRNRMSAVTYYATGGRLSYSNYTLDAIEQAFQDQLEILSDRKAEELQAENEKLKDNLSDAEAIILTYQTELKELYKSNDKLQAENKKLKKEIMLIRQGYDEESCIETCPEVQALRKELDNFRRID